MLPQAAAGNIQGGSGATLQNAGGANINRTPILSPASSSGGGAGSNITTTGGSGSGSGTTTDPNAVAYYNDVVNQLTSELNAARGQQSTGMANITNAFKQSENELNDQQSTALSGYNTQAAENGQQRETNLGTIATGANSAYNGLMSLLGASGAGVSSAARYAAPQAVSQNASQQRGQADTTYNTNATNINSAETTTKQQYKDALSDLLTQKNSQTQSFLSNLLGSEANLEQQIGSAKINAAEYGGKSYGAAEAGISNETNAVKGIESKLNSIFKQYATPSFSVTPVTAAIPNLTNFSYDPTTVQASASNPTTDTSFLPYLTSLKQSQPTSGITTGGAVTAGAS